MTDIFRCPADRRLRRHPATVVEADARAYQPGIHKLRMKKKEARRLLAETRRDEVAQMVHCDGIQREVVAFVGKANRWGDRCAFFRTCGNGAGNRKRIQEALTLQVSQIVKAHHPSSNLTANQFSKTELLEEQGRDPRLGP